jgi:hypothetical protein
MDKINLGKTPTDQPDEFLDGPQDGQPEGDLDPEQLENEDALAKRKRKRDLILIVIGILLFLFIFLSLWTSPSQKDIATSSPSPASRVSYSTGSSTTATPGASSGTSSGGSTGSSGGIGGTGGSGGAAGTGGTSLTTHNYYYTYTTYVTPTPTPNPTPTPTHTPTPTPSSTSTPTPTPSSTSTPTPVFTPRVLGVRKAILAMSKPLDNRVDFIWRTTVAATVRAIRIQTCISPVQSEPCVVPTGASMSATTLISTGGELGATGWSYAVSNNHEALLTNATGAALTVGGEETASIDGFVNPNFIGTFFFRITTYSDVSAAPGYLLEYGGFATSTVKSITTTADVAETMMFIVANTVNSDCTGQTDIPDPNDSTEDLVQLSPNPVSLVGTSIGTAQFCVMTNAQFGFVVTYRDEALGGASKGFWNGTHEFPAPISQFASSPGIEQFGFNLRNNAIPNVGSDPDGSGLVADLVNPDYSTVDRFSYNDTGNPIVLAQKPAPALSARYTLAYVANASALTPAGTYQAHQIFICTATF